MKEFELKDFRIESKDKDHLEVYYKDSKISKNVSKGNDALYVKLSGVGEGLGVKLVHPGRKSPDSFAYESNTDMCDQIKYIQNKELEIFPKIYDVFHDEEEDRVQILMEHVKGDNTENEWKKYDWIPSPDKAFLNREFNVSLSVLDEYNKIILENGLIPDTSWFKVGKNFIGDKIIDFHRFRYVPERYYFKSRGKTVNDLEELYDGFLKRYKAMPQSPPKWYRAGIYEGFRFDNGYEFKGYSSDNEEYDSYRKLNFQYLTLTNNSTVLDIGSNQGFFCFQSVIHGAKRVVGIEKQLEDYQTAVDINNNIFNFDEIEFINGDAKNYVLKTEESFDVVIMNSVLHQLYPNFGDTGDDCAEFMRKISKKAKKVLVFETPVDHPKMNITAEKIYTHLKRYFYIVKISYVYDAYSTGYRIIFICIHK
jgi:16S rRNA G966 N2-methylase RsmD